MIRYVYIILCVLSFGILHASNDSGVIVIDWSETVNYTGEEIYTFTRVFYSDENPSYPLYYNNYYSNEPGVSITAKVVNPVFDRINEADLLATISKDDIPDKLTFYSENGMQKGVSLTTFFVNPFYKQFGIIYRLKSFSIETGKAVFAQQQKDEIFAGESVMAHGQWYHFYVEETGMYSLSGKDLTSMGVDIAAVDPDNIAIFGNGGGMLPEDNSESRPSDIQQMAIQLIGGEDGTFDPDDKLIFYAEGPHVWRYNNSYHRYQHFTNIYSEKAGYYVAIIDEKAKRIGYVESASDSITHIINSYTRLLLHESEDHNLVHSGKDWYGHEFTPAQTDYTVAFHIPDVDTTAQSFIRAELVAHSNVDDCYYYVNHNDTEILSCTVKGITAGDNTTYARSKSTQKYIENPSTDSFDLDITFEPGNNNSLGWLDFIELHATAFLKYRGQQFDFRNLPSFGYERVAQFNVKSYDENILIWDVTDFTDAASVNFFFVDDTARFIRPSMELHEYVAFTFDDLMTPEFGGKMENQNLHGATAVDYLIVTYPDLLAQAERLAQMHENLDGFSTMIVTPSEIYNEFSAGVQDITAIRDFIRSMYLKSNGEQPRYVVLMGDASYDYKDRLVSNTNFVPTFQSKQSLSLSSSWDTDDYYGLMDEDEGDDAYGLLDIGIGRFPVSTVEQADRMIDKIECYLTPNIETAGNWRNKIVFIADDGDTNLHMKQAEDLTDKVDTIFRNVNVDKIYYDAYQRVSVSGGYRFPDAKDAVISAVENGAIIINYTGHGGETGWGAENVLEIPDINSWTNFKQLPVFITATCEFSRYDNPEHTSAGELVILNPNGGAVSMLTTSRLSFAQINYVLNDRIYDIALNTIEEEQPALGDLMVYAKVPHQKSTKNFVILGDPALKLMVPKLKVITEGIEIMDETATLSLNDTVRGMEKFSVRGRIFDAGDAFVEGFNGSVNVRLYDKPSVYSTLGQSYDSQPKEFELRDKLLFDGLAEVKNGEFEMEILVPREINYQYGAGKISYYAIDSTSLAEASGYYENLVIGGYNETALNDNTGPEIRAYMNNSHFVNNDKTNENPLFMAEISDPCGINCIGTSIGHNITAYLDDNVGQIIDLNDYFTFTPGVYNSGKVIYPFTNLEEGLHSVTIKAWDLCNNSSVTTINFIVSSTLGVEINTLNVFPNPVDDYTDITFMHNMPGRTLDVIFEIYDVTGRKIRTLETTEYFESTAAGPYRWDRRDYYGRKVKAGAYPFRVSIRSNSGAFTVTGGTLMLK